MNLTHYNLCNKIERTPIMKKFLKIICCVVLALTFVVGTPLVELSTGFNVSSSAAYAATKISKPEIHSMNYDHYLRMMKLSWKKCSGAQKYWVYCSENNGKYQRVRTTTKTSYEIGIPYNTNCSFKVKAIGKNGKKSSFSNVINILVKNNDNCYDEYFGIPDFGFRLHAVPYDIFHGKSGSFYFYDRDDLSYDSNGIVSLYGSWLSIYGFNYPEKVYDSTSGTYNYLYIRDYDNMGVMLVITDDIVKVAVLKGN